MIRSTLMAAATAALCTAGVSAQAEGVFRQAYDMGSGSHSSCDPISKGRVLLITEKVMSRLIRPGADGLPVPDLAHAWDVNDDGTIWTLRLRDGVTFHDGSTFDSADVKYSLERILDPQADNPARPVIEMIREIKTPDPLTVELHLSSRFADLPLQLMDYRLRMIPEGSGDTIAVTGIGTGPFKLDRFDPDGITTLTAFDDYWEGPPRLDEIQIIGIPDSQARLQAFLGGQIDMDRSINPRLRTALDHAGKFTLQEVPTGNWNGISVRTDMAPFDDERVRRALRMAIDREALLNIVLDGRGVVSCDTPVAPNDQYRARLDCPQDIAGARALLAEAGYPDGLSAEMYIASIDPSWQTMAVAVQAQAREAGFDLKITQAAADGYWSEVWGKKPMFATSWGERPADQILNEAFRSTAKWNETKFNDPVFDQLLDEARTTLNFEERRALYVGAQTYLQKHSGILIPFHVSQLVGLSADVEGLPPVRNDAIRWHLVSMRNAQEQAALTK